MVFLPIFLIIFLSLINLYLGVVYRRYIPEITENNYMDFNNLEYFNFQNSVNNQLSKYPPYLDRIIKKKKNGQNYEEISNVVDNNEIADLLGNSSERKEEDSQNENESKVNVNIFNGNGFSITQHFNIRAANFFEDCFVFGKTGLVILTNINQLIVVVFTAWCTIMIGKYFWDISQRQNNSILLMTIAIALFFFYILVILLVNMSNIKYLNILNSTEANQNEEIIRKVINKQSVNSAAMSNSIFQVFKKIYFDIMIHNKNNKSNSDKERETYDDEKREWDYSNFNSLNKADLKQMIDLNIIRFKFLEVEKDSNLQLILENTGIQLGDELKNFIKSCGNGQFTDKEVENMLHLIENFEKIKETKTLSNRDFYDIWGATIHFSKIQSEKILRTVIDCFLKDSSKGNVEEVDPPKLFGINNKKKEEKIDKFGIDTLKRLLDWYLEYFSRDERDYLLLEASNLQPNFTKDIFISYFLGSCQFCPQ